MKFRKFDISQKKQRKALIEIFVNAIFLYDDRMLITFNYKDGTQTVRFEDTLTADCGEKSLRLRSNESPSGAFEQQNGLAQARWRAVPRQVRICPTLLDQKLHRRICSSVELFCLPTAWSENEKRMQNVVRLKNVRTDFCKKCRISCRKLCILSNKNCPNVLILRKKLHKRLQKGNRLVYFMVVNVTSHGS